MVHYQMKVLESYLSDPEMHVEVCGDPNFSGGPATPLGDPRQEHKARTGRSFNE